MRKFMIIMFAVLFAFLFGCEIGSVEPIPDDTHVTTDEFETASVELTSSQLIGNQKSTLYINGIEITDNDCVVVKSEIENAELPLLTIMEELGADIRWINDRIVEIEYDDIILTIDTTSNDFGIPSAPGNQYVVRKKVGNEIVFDLNTTQILLKNMLKANISVDYDNLIVNVSDT